MAPRWFSVAATAPTAVALVLGWTLWEQLAAPSTNGLLDAPVPATGSPLALALNHMDSKAYPHHPVMAAVGLGPFPVEPGYITEWNGLKVPAEYDCDMFCSDGLEGCKRHRDGRFFWGNHQYFLEVPSRWQMCWTHLANVNSANRLMYATLPLIDDEYNEQVAVYQSVLRARGKFVVAELGARWGTWGARSLALLRHARPELDHEMLAVESYPVSCRAIERVLAVNNLTGTVLCELATPQKMLAWSNGVDHIDLVDFDIQGGEHSLIPEIMGMLNSKVYRVIIGTHAAGAVSNAMVHGELRDLFGKEHGWLPIADIPPQLNMGTIRRHLRTGGRLDPRNVWHQNHNETDEYKKFGRWEALLEATPRAWHDVGGKGPVANVDGELIFDNPRFVDRSKVLSLEDTALRVDDLK